ncbi:MAG: MoxR family ATPase [Lachnospiraceae bacterium]|nr:MoxR family ATPase [Lachnospiraceae bacterium]
MSSKIVKEIKNEITKAVVGKDDIIEQVLAAIFAGGHVLLEDVPGVGKTTLALAFSRALSMDYKRIQFTPDVLPSDVVGFSMFNKKINDFEFREGAAMCNILLADEINRTSSKTQAALLEVMEEAKVTVDGITHYLPDPFFVIATQNPMGYVGTQKLPESQLDRFMIRLSMGYPDMESEIDIYNGKSNKSLDKVKKVIDIDTIREIRNKVSEVNMDEKLMIYLVSFIRETRENEYISLGVSPRGGIALMKMAKSRAFMDDRDYVVPEDIINSIEPVTVHRVVLNSKAKANGLDEKQVIELVKKSVAIP